MEKITVSLNGTPDLQIVCEKVVILYKQRLFHNCIINLNIKYKNNCFQNST